MSSESTDHRSDERAAFKIQMASADDIRSWSSGEVKTSQITTFSTVAPKPGGLFCERIFGRRKDCECLCGKYRGARYKGSICDRCGDDATLSSMRMGHIELAAPVVHPWYFRTMPSHLSLLLGIKRASLERVIYYQDYVVVDPGGTAFRPLQILTEDTARQACAKYVDASFEIETGAEALKKLLVRLDLAELSSRLRQDLGSTDNQRRKKQLVKRLEVIESLRDSGNKPEWMVLDVIPVVPRELRPLSTLDSGDSAKCDLNELYAQVLDQNHRLLELIQQQAPEDVLSANRCKLQQSVDALFDNRRCSQPVVDSSNHRLKSLTDLIQRRFRKRVDYSARSVVVVGPELQLHQCGLPKTIAIELFKPFVVRRLMERRLARTVELAEQIVDRRDEELWDILAAVMTHHPVLLSRGGTLQRTGLQAFEPVLIEGNAITIHPLVCKAFNVAFDGDELTVHLPLSIEAQTEAKTLMMSAASMFQPANGAPAISPSQDMAMGIHYLTLKRHDQLGEGMVFASTAEVLMAFAHKKVARHAIIKLRMARDKRVVGEGSQDYQPGDRMTTTVGRVMFNDALPREMAFYNVTIKDADLAGIISDCDRELGRTKTVELLDRLKTIGFHEMTEGGISLATSDLELAPNRNKIIAEAEAAVIKQQKLFERQLITNSERYNQVLDTWTYARQQIRKSMMHELERDHRDGSAYVNPLHLMARSGTDGSVELMQQSLGFRGLMAKYSGEILEIPIKGNLREGLTMLDYFRTTHAPRYGLFVAPKRRCDLQRFTRALANVCEGIVITEHDCQTSWGIQRAAIDDGRDVPRSLADAIYGRVSRETIINPITDEVVVRENELITLEIARCIEELGVDKLEVRSPVACQAQQGICRLCYGMDLSTGALVEEGMAVGIVATQCIGEPGMQLTMRAFHTGSREVEETEIRTRRAGRVRFARIRSIVNSEGRMVVLSQDGEIIIMDPKERELEKHVIPNGATLLISEDDEVQANQVLCQWDPHSVPILAEVDGKVRFEDCVEGRSIRSEKEASGSIRRTVIEHKGELHPQIILEDGTRRVLDVYYLPERASIEVEDRQQMAAGAILAQKPRERAVSRVFVGGFPRMNELLEARKPKDPAILSEIDGRVDRVTINQQGEQIVAICSEFGNKSDYLVEHIVPRGKRLIVNENDFVRAGEPLVSGPRSLQDILRILGAEAVVQQLLEGIHNAQRSLPVEIDDKHFEIVIAQMLRKRRIDRVGDTRLIPGTVIDKCEHRRINEALEEWAKVTDPGDSDCCHADDVVPYVTVEEINFKLQAAGKRQVKVDKPRPATGSSVLLGISELAVQNSGILSVVGSRETAKMLAAAALAGKVEHLTGMKENVILGRLVPAGTGFHRYQQAQVQIGPEAQQ